MRESAVAHEVDGGLAVRGLLERRHTFMTPTFAERSVVGCARKADTGAADAPGTAAVTVRSAVYAVAVDGDLTFRDRVSRDACGWFKAARQPNR
jgi:hypothetical protein